MDGLPPPPAAAATGATSTALAIVPSGPSGPARQERSAIVTSKEIDSLHGDEISRRLAEFGKAAPTGIYSKPRGK
jgi:hypothetical protein